MAKMHMTQPLTKDQKRLETIYAELSAYDGCQSPEEDSSDLVRDWKTQGPPPGLFIRTHHG